MIGPGGDVIGATPPLGERRVLTAAQLAQATRRPVLLDRGPLPGLDDPVRVLAKPIGEDGQARVVVVGASRDDRDGALASLLALLVTGGPVALLLASLAGYGLASAALRPVEAMRRRAG